MIKINDLHVKGIKEIVSPLQLKEMLPADEKVLKLVSESRKTISNIINGRDKRFLIVVGPCSIHDPSSAAEYAKRLAGLQEKIKGTIYLVMRAYFEKPRTALGWRGLIIDPELDGSYRIEKGLKTARKILIDILKKGLPTATEMLDPIIPQYIADLISWSAIGARTTESQIHRELASGLSMPVGFKNSTDGSLDSAVNAQISSKSGHSFIGIDQVGRTCIVSTKGNPDTHIILRGGKNGPNYYEENIEDAENILKENGLVPALLIDCSHANSSKKHERQARVFQATVSHKLQEYRSLIGAMLESNLFEGAQCIPENKKDLKYGVSITDECIGWEETEKMIHEADQKLRRV